MEPSEDTEGGSSSSEEEVEVEQVERKSQETESEPESDDHEAPPPAQVAKRKVESHEPPAKRNKKGGIRGAMSAYLIYWKEVQANLKAENPALVHTDLAKLCGQNWKALSDEEKQLYKDKAEADKSRYESERAAGGGEEVPEDGKKPRKTGFVLFSKANRRELKRDHPDLTPTEYRKMLSEKWKAMSAEEKREFGGGRKSGKKGGDGGLTDDIDDLVAQLRKKVESRMLRSDIGFIEMKGLLEIVCQKSNYELLKRLDAFPSS